MKLILILLSLNIVATAPTVYGIETIKLSVTLKDLYNVATAPTVYGIET